MRKRSNFCELHIEPAPSRTGTPRWGRFPDRCDTRQGPEDGGKTLAEGICWKPSSRPETRHGPSASALPMRVGRGGTALLRASRGCGKRGSGGPAAACDGLWNPNRLERARPANPSSPCPITSLDAHGGIHRTTLRRASISLAACRCRSVAESTGIGAYACLCAERGARSADHREKGETCSDCAVREASGAVRARHEQLTRRARRRR